MTSFDLAILLAISLKCPAPDVQNTTKLEWTSVDTANMGHAAKRCGTLYKDSRCLKKFIKVGFQSYKAICGKPNHEYSN